MPTSNQDNFSHFDRLAARPHTVIIDGRRYPSSTTAGNSLNLAARPLLTDPTPPEYKRQELEQPGTPPFMVREATGAPNANKSPLDLEFATLRIDPNLAVSADWFYTTWTKANRNWKADSQDKVPPGELTGPEIAADADLCLRYIAYRLAELYPVIVDGVINETPMAGLAPAADLGNVRADRYGRRRLVEALTLLSVAHDAWVDLAYSRAAPSTWALGQVSKRVAPMVLHAANDNGKAVGRRYLRAA